MRNISFSLTERQFLDHSKDVTRRLGFRDAKPGELLRAIRKGMGLKKGEKVEPLGLIRIVSVVVEPLNRMTEEPIYGDEECRREGYPEKTPAQFVKLFCQAQNCKPETEITRIQFEHVTGERTPA